MKVIYGITKIRKFAKPVVALGVFDGVHLGHRRILKVVADKAKRIKGTSIAVTFWPHPQKEKSIYSLEHRLRLISEVGIDTCIVIGFNKRFSQIPAEDFIRDILVNKIGAQYIYVGRNFRFGKQARGDFKTLNRLSHIYNFKLKLFDIIKINNQPISSTYIRRLITRGKLNAAGKLLSRPVSVLGTVIRGTSLASRLGFPTANIDPHHEVLLPSGIYAVSVIFNHKNFQGVCYIGSKPTLKRQIEKHIEVYIFNFRKNIYGKYLEVQFIKKIRNERKFRSPESLIKQVKKDISAVKRLFSLHF
ncbi:MAG: bifunctional riboflavin kinase/FMN adenylyltransferase [Candidatus Omnitrophica bacterium CG23_combo_of_CG06-09_8_20_14_all_40_11]|nr:MAG: bifunctional riboflavin kinase/FMN adenylyltransferase [Candidatus Omnitrophica bacterium CG23_combo_of_CG06-09_8_20_14_all_40_11]